MHARFLARLLAIFHRDVSAGETAAGRCKNKKSSDPNQLFHRVVPHV
jgi:hypothetical protein